MKKSTLNRLVINLSQDCNLRCKYCYADFGLYRGPRQSLSLEKGKQIIDFFLNVYNRISGIQFFGGEPFLNYQILEPLCEYILESFKVRTGVTPALSIITNGTVINKEIISIIRKYKVLITVSLDGLGSINDSLRGFKNKKGTFKRIDSNIRILRQEAGQPKKIEGTFTSEHLRQNFSFVEFMEYLVEDLKIHSLHMPWVIGNGYSGCGIIPNSPNIKKIIEVYTESLSKSLNSLISPEINQTIINTYFERYLERRFGNTSYSNYVCPAGIDTLAVSVEGVIYPCFMFIGNKSFELGRVGETSPLDFIRNKTRFSTKMKRAEQNYSSENIPLMFCAGINHEINGSLAKIPHYEIVLAKEFNNFLDHELNRLLKTQQDWEWLQSRYIIHNALLGIEE